jgi:glycosyltransferase involved in cell wall biosynthesis
VEEVLQHGVNGLLVDFFDVGGVADRVVEALEQGDAFQALRARARSDAVQRYDVAQGEQAYSALLQG